MRPLRRPITLTLFFFCVEDGRTTLHLFVSFIFSCARSYCFLFPFFFFLHPFLLSHPLFFFSFLFLLASNAFSTVLLLLLLLLRLPCAVAICLFFFFPSAAWKLTVLPFCLVSIVFFLLFFFFFVSVSPDNLFFTSENGHARLGSLHPGYPTCHWKQKGRGKPRRCGACKDPCEVHSR